jgi:ATP-dependent Zn protease
MYIRMSESGMSVLRMIGSAVVFCIIVYLLFFRNGAMGDLFSSNYVPAETNVKITFKDVKGSEEAKEELTDIGNA